MKRNNSKIVLWAFITIVFLIITPVRANHSATIYIEQSEAGDYPVGKRIDIDVRIKFILVDINLTNLKLTCSLYIGYQIAKEKAITIDEYTENTETTKNFDSIAAYAGKSISTFEYGEQYKIVVKFEGTNKETSNPFVWYVDEYFILKDFSESSRSWIIIAAIGGGILIIIILSSGFILKKKGRI
jgi:hypothetical protein